MLCSNCGFENPTGHRFCGMCGTPLPQRPIIAPGAQSTADLTRHPLEVSPPAGSTAANLSHFSAPSATQTIETAPMGTSKYFSQAEQAESLEQFIAGFQYTPPAEEDEVTMTGAKPELDDAAKYDPVAPISMSEETAVTETPARVSEPLQPQTTAVEDLRPAESAVEEAPVIITEPPPFATSGIKDRSPERSRFLDLSPPTQEASSNPVHTSIGGPSFLGLSDTPATSAYIGDEGAPRHSHWRAWTALVVLGIFAALGALEWRAEKNQSSNGPIGIMRMQIERLKGKKAIITPPPSSEATTEPAEPASTSQPNASGPQMQVAPQKKPQTATPQPANNGATAPATPANPGAASSSPAATAATTAQQSSTPAGSSENGAKLAQKTQSPPEKPKSANSSSNSTAPSDVTAESKPEKPEKATAPGAEELTKAANASDAAAASAWLWKSVAKGNPEAPVKLANMYIKGDGVPQSCEQAMVLLRSAAAKDNAAARSRLGAMYATGTCVARSRVRAYQYMSQALEANPSAVWPRQFKQQLWAQMTPQERQQVQQ